MFKIFIYISRTLNIQSSCIQMEEYVPHYKIDSRNHIAISYYSSIIHSPSVRSLLSKLIPTFTTGFSEYVKRSEYSILSI